MPLRMIDIRLNGSKCDRVDRCLLDLVARQHSDRRRDRYEKTSWVYACRLCLVRRLENAEKTKRTKENLKSCSWHTKRRALGRESTSVVYVKIQAKGSARPWCLCALVGLERLSPPGSPRCAKSGPRPEARKACFPGGILSRYQNMAAKEDCFYDSCAVEPRSREAHSVVPKCDQDFS